MLVDLVLVLVEQQVLTDQIQFFQQKLQQVEVEVEVEDHPPIKVRMVAQVVEMVTKEVVVLDQEIHHPLVHLKEMVVVLEQVDHQPLNLVEVVEVVQLSQRVMVLLVEVVQVEQVQQLLLVQHQQLMQEVVAVVLNLQEELEELAEAELEKVILAVE